MSYRDDRDADQARIAALEVELARARERIDELEGKRSQALVRVESTALTARGPETAASRWFGPTRLHLARTFPGAFPIDKLEDLVERIREITRDPGRTELLRSSLTWFASTSDKSAGPRIVVTVTVRDGNTTLTITDRLGQLAGALYGGFGGGVGGGGLVIPVMAAVAMPVLTPVFVAAWLGGVFAGTRAIFRRAARRRAESLAQVFDVLAGEIERGIAAAKPAPDAP